MQKINLNASFLLLLATKVYAYSSSLRASSSFTGSSLVLDRSFGTSSHRRGCGISMYGEPTDPPNDRKKDSGPIWSALASTEHWISETLGGGPNNNNPYKRKEVSYVCESGDTPELIAANIFSRLVELREAGETHGDLQVDKGFEDYRYEPRTLRQTLVVVIPSCSEILSSFHIFDNLINAINNARRNARDYVTDISLEKQYDEEDYTKTWITSVNMAHMHPRYGEPTPEQILQQEKEMDEQGEVDLNLEEYKRRRMMARQSPFPTIVMEVKSSPPMQMPEPPANSQMPAPGSPRDENSSDVSREDLKKLEALFGQTASQHPDDVEDVKSENDDDFYNALGNVFNDELTFITPTELATNWVMQNDALFQPEISSFVKSDVKHVDCAYEFVFSNIVTNRKLQADKRGLRSYLVMPNFLSASATSFHKFDLMVKNIISTIPGLDQIVETSTMHPEHIDQNYRSPVPIFVLQWKNMM